MLLVPFLIAAALDLSPALPPSYAKHVAETIASVTESKEEATLLLVTNAGESSLRRDVETCEKTGDGGLAISSYQLHWWHWGGYSRSEICARPTLATGLALRALSGDGDYAHRIARFMGRKPTNPEVLRRAAVVVAILENAEAEP
jgi:hypothetical protein